MNLRVVGCLVLRLGLFSMMGGAVPALAAGPPVADPPNGLHAQALGATRLSPEQKQQVKVISHAPLAPFYPKEAALTGRTGKVVIDLLIDADGNVKDAMVLDENPPLVGFGDAAISVMRTYKFVNPYGRLVVFTATVPFSP